MMPGTDLTFADIVALLDAAVGGAETSVGFHGAFWRHKTRDDFVATPPYRDVTPVVVGDSSRSGLIEALAGNGLFATGLIERMPPFGPYMSDADIARIAAWIDAGCPE